MTFTKSIFRQALRHYGSQQKMANALGIDRRYMSSIKTRLYDPSNKRTGRPMPKAKMDILIRDLNLEV